MRWSCEDVCVSPLLGEAIVAPGHAVWAGEFGLFGSGDEIACTEEKRRLETTARPRRRSPDGVEQAADRAPAAVDSQRKNTSVTITKIGSSTAPL